MIELTKEAFIQALAGMAEELIADVKAQGMRGKGRYQRFTRHAKKLFGMVGLKPTQEELDRLWGE